MCGNGGNVTISYLGKYIKLTGRFSADYPLSFKLTKVSFSCIAGGSCNRICLWFVYRGVKIEGCFDSYHKAHVGVLKQGHEFKLERK